MVKEPALRRPGRLGAAAWTVALALACAALWLSGGAAPAGAADCTPTVTPLGGNVVVTRASVIAATWNVGTAANQCSSAFGLFSTCAPSNNPTDPDRCGAAGFDLSPSDPRVIGQVSFPLITVGRGARQFVPETLLIPAETSLRALKLGLTHFFYGRIWNNFGQNIPNAPGQITCRLSTSAFGIFSIGRIEIYFSAGRNDILVRKGTQGLKAYADILFNGTGTLRARWLVAEPGARIPAAAQSTARQTFVPDNIFRPDDWRILSYVEKTVTFGDRIVLESPEFPSLPTFITGQHLVRLEILQDRQTDAQVGIQLPVARYYVEGDRVGFQVTRAGTPVRLSAPADGAQLAQAPPPTFSWFAVPGSAQYRVEIYEADPRAGAFGGISGDPSVELYRSGGGAMRAITLMDAVGQKVFSAVTQGAVTSLPLHPGYLGRFRPRQVYLWKVVAVDGRGDPIGASALRALSFRAQ